MATPLPLRPHPTRVANATDLPRESILYLFLLLSSLLSPASLSLNIHLTVLDMRTCRHRLDASGHTLLHYAVLRNDKAMTHLLLGLGAALDFKTSFGESAVNLSITYTSPTPSLLTVMMHCIDNDILRGPPGPFIAFITSLHTRSTPPEPNLKLEAFCLGGLRQHSRVGAAR